jgi:hypothetical protein
MVTSSESFESQVGPTLDKPRGKLVEIAKGRPVHAPLAIFLGALFMAWPAFLNGFPIMYPDTLDYLQAGRLVARALFLHRMSSFYGLHSLIYALGILPLHWDITVWPVMALQCLLTSYVLWLVVRSIVPTQTASRFLILMLFLCLLSSLSWYGSFVMPDILGPDLYLCIYLLVFARASISRMERYSLYLICWWAIASHFTHLVVVIGLCFLLALLAIFHSKPLRKNLIPAAELASLILLATCAQIALDTYLDSQSTNRMIPLPFLIPHLIGNGPGKQYLQTHCGEANWEICKYTNHLAGNGKDFLWKSSGAWMSATEDSKKLILSQDLPLALAIVRAYPMEELEQSALNSWIQLKSFELQVAERHIVVERQIAQAWPSEQSKFFASRQPRGQLPRRLFTSIEYCVVIVSLLGLAALLPWLWRRRPARLLGMGLVILSTIILNAIVIGTLAMVENRFQARVIWMVPLLAALCALDRQASRYPIVSLHPKP